MPLPLTTVFCPRCDRPFVGEVPSETLEKAKKHVAGQHPDHDPDWWQTYPEIEIV